VVKQLIGWIRISILIAILWIVFFFIGGLAYGHLGKTLLLAIIPLLTGLAFLCIIRISMPANTNNFYDKKMDIKQLDDLEAKAHKIKSELSDLEKSIQRP
jgi:hypothetical protein